MLGVRFSGNQLRGARVGNEGTGAVTRLVLALLLAVVPLRGGGGAVLRRLIIDAVACESLTQTIHIRVGPTGVGPLGRRLAGGDLRGGRRIVVRALGAVHGSVSCFAVDGRRLGDRRVGVWSW